MWIKQLNTPLKWIAIYPEFSIFLTMYVTIGKDLPINSKSTGPLQKMSPFFLFQLLSA